MSVRQKILDLLTTYGPMTQREIAYELKLDMEYVRGYIGAIRQKKPRVLYVHSYRRDEDGGRLYPRALWAVGDKPDAKRLPRLSKTQYNKRGKAKMKHQVASIFHTAFVNKNNTKKLSVSRSFGASNES